MPDGTIHIVDDDDAVRKSLKLLVSTTGLNAVEYDSAHDFLQRYEPSKPECLLLDLRMPGMDGLELQRELKKRDANIATVFLSGHGDIPLAVRALREGALDFVEKPFKNEQLVERLWLCIQTDAEIEQARISKQEAEERLALLTQREREVMNMLVQGKINKVIASELGLSTRTVESHRARAMKKLRVTALTDVFKLILATEDGSRISRHYVPEQKGP